MPDPGSRYCPGSFDSYGRGVRWTALLVLSVLLVLTLEVAGLPAAQLLGPMVAAIMIAAAGGALQVAHWPYLVAQGVVGCMIARSLTPSILSTVGQDWPLFLALIGAVIGASGSLGWLLARWRVLPGTTAIWGSAPGAATAMTLLAEAHGADVRLVAFMQYLRVVLVVILASVIARLWVTPSGEVAGGVAAGPGAGVAWFPPIHWGPFAATLALAGFGPVAAWALRIPAGPLLVPLLLGAVLHNAGVMTIELPPWLLAASYALVGWSIGLRFTRPILVHALRALPRLVASILVLIALCGGLAVILVLTAGVDPLTAYLATSPGGADSVAIIAGSSDVNLPFVMAMQTARFLVVLLVGPGVARFFARRTGVASEDGG
jgi:hypothetical protein